MACQISRRIEHRPITEEEFKKQKNMQPYKGQRQISKSLNFLLIFGGSGKVFANQALDIAWTPEQVDAYLETNDPDGELLEYTAKVYAKETPQEQRYIAAATHMRTKFFEGYPSLKARIDREKNYCAEHGYNRSVFGQSRNLIELMLRGEWDNKNLSGILRNLENIAVNVKAQNMEACIRGRAQYEVQGWLEKNEYISKTWNEIHDSADFWVSKDQKEFCEVLAHIKHVFERQIPEIPEKDWVPLVVDCEVSDLLKGDYYKGGHAPEQFGFNWSDGGEFEDPDPFFVELSPAFEMRYFARRADYWKKKGQPDPIQNKIDEYFQAGLNLKN